MRLGRSLVLPILVVGCFVLAACGGGSSSSSSTSSSGGATTGTQNAGSVKQGGTIKIGTVGPDNYDPQQYQTVQADSALHLVYTGLLAFKDGTGTERSRSVVLASYASSDRVTRLFNRLASTPTLNSVFSSHFRSGFGMLPPGASAGISVVPEAYHATPSRDHFAVEHTAGRADKVGQQVKLECRQLDRLAFHRGGAPRNVQADVSGVDDLTLRPRAQRPDRLIGDAVLEELHRAVEQ